MDWFSYAMNILCDILLKGGVMWTTGLYAALLGFLSNDKKVGEREKNSVVRQSFK